MDLKIHRFIHSDKPTTCRNCGNHFQGKICNSCGEKKFDESQLSAGHFFHQIVDFFTHFESKVLKTIWLNIRKPGFITKQNIEGIRVPYAKPVQFYLIVSILFYFAVTKINVTDYTPGEYDHYYYPVSAYLPFKWAAPVDSAVINYIDTLRIHKYEAIQEEIVNDHYFFDSAAKGYKVYATFKKDSATIQPQQLTAVTSNEARMMFHKTFTASVSTYSKTLIFITLPFIAAFFFLFFFRSLKYYGSALILSTHFMVYNLCFFIFHCIVDWLPYRITGSNTYRGVLFKPLELLYTPTLQPVTEFLFGGVFEMLHLIFWMPWLFIAFRRLFGKPWWVNLLVSYACSRIFFYLLFGVLKKFMIIFTIWTLH